jgi:hypothetical protein
MKKTCFSPTSINCLRHPPALFGCIDTFPRAAALKSQGGLSPPGGKARSLSSRYYRTSGSRSRQSGRGAISGVGSFSQCSRQEMIRFVRWTSIIVGGLLFAMVSAVAAEQAMPPGVLILDDSGGPAAGPFYPAIIAGLRGAVNRDPSKQYSIYIENLDFHRFNGPEYELGLKQYYISKYKRHPLAVIVAVGAGALQYVLRSREEIWPAVPVVFTFVDPQLLSALPANVTGTTFRLKLSDMIAAARAVVPDLSRIALVGDPVETLVPYRHMKEEVPAVAAAGLEVIDLTGMPMREVRTRVASLPDRTAILYPGMYSDGEGTYLTRSRA